MKRATVIIVLGALGLTILVAIAVMRPTPPNINERVGPRSKTLEPTIKGVVLVTPERERLDSKYTSVLKECSPSVWPWPALSPKSSIPATPLVVTRWQQIADQVQAAAVAEGKDSAHVLADVFAAKQAYDAQLSPSERAGMKAWVDAVSATGKRDGDRWRDELLRWAEANRAAPEFLEKYLALVRCINKKGYEFEVTSDNRDFLEAERRLAAIRATANASFRSLPNSGDPGRLLCGDLTMDREKCYSVDWTPWVVDAVRKEAGDRYDDLRADMYVMGAAIPIQYPDKTHRLVFSGCRQHACPDAYAYVLIDPVGRTADIVWRRGEEVIYLGERASLLRERGLLYWLDEVSRVAG